MNTLRINYGFFIPCLRNFAPNGFGRVIPDQHSCTGIRTRRPDMFLKSVMMLLCTAGIAFYVRFLVALYKESKTRSSGYWVRLRFSSGEATIGELPKGR